MEVPSITGALCYDIRPLSRPAADFHQLPTGDPRGGRRSRTSSTAERFRRVAVYRGLRICTTCRARLRRPRGALGRAARNPNACPFTSACVDAASLRLELMQQDGVALAVQAHRHPTNRTVDDIALEGDTLVLEVGHEAIEVLDLERNRAAGGIAWFFLGEVGEGQAAAAGQVVFHPPVVPLVASRAGLEAECLLVELARPRHVGDRVIREGDFLEHRTPFLATRSAKHQQRWHLEPPS